MVVTESWFVPGLFGLVAAHVLGLCQSIVFYTFRKRVLIVFELSWGPAKEKSQPRCYSIHDNLLFVVAH